MSEPAVHEPHSFALLQINSIAENLGNIERLPDGRCRDLDGPTAIGALTVRSNLAIASALLAVADAIRSSSAAEGGG